VSFCTGAFTLAFAGALDGRRATTHWRWAADFASRFPEVSLEPDVLFVDDGDVLTAAGSSAALDLGLHLVRRDHGERVGARVAKAMVAAPHRDGGQAQFIQRPVPEPRASSTGVARAWALEHLDRPVRLLELAAKESMSVRTFTRRFHDEVGLTPGQWLTHQRIERARQLLESTDLPIDRIATEAGFGSESSLRQHLGASLGVPPSVYRRTFRAV
jgi:transcriptional regulator GlxA family with amidase domain